MNAEQRANNIIEPLRRMSLDGIEAAKRVRGDAPETPYEVQKEQVKSRLSLLEKQIAAEIRAAEQTAREKALRSAAKLMCDDCDDDEVAYQKADKSYWHSDVSQGGEEIEWRCGASDILRLLEEKND